MILHSFPCIFGFQVGFPEANSTFERSIFRSKSLSSSRAKLVPALGVASARAGHGDPADTLFYKGKQRVERSAGLVAQAAGRQKATWCAALSSAAMLRAHSPGSPTHPRDVKLTID